MEILCPHCQFSREVDESKIPARSQIATCPKCQTKFKFRDLPDEEDFALENPEPSRQDDAALASDKRETLHRETDSGHDADMEPANGIEMDPAPRDEPQSMPRVEPEDAFPGLPGDDDTAGQEKHERPARDNADAEDDALWNRLNDMRPPRTGHRSDRDQPEQANSGPEPIPGWTGEFNESFPDPMDDNPTDHSVDETMGEAGPQVPPPFEQLDRYGFFPGLFLTVKLILRTPRLFFAVMPVGGGLAKPLTFTILVTMIQGLAQYFWQAAGLSTSMGAASPEAGGGAAEALMMLLFMPAIIAAGQFAITGVYHLLMIAMRADSQGFEGTFRALAYANAPLILGVFPMPGMQVEIGWMGIVAVWVLILTIIGLKYIHKASYSKVVPVALIPLLLGLIGGIMAYYSQLATI
ncbi:hypothetical protein GKC30_00615 [Pseudodesulfovibrio sp. F-1]|uniref:Yip1 domain-containing protein n=1 Tax=Pseudodesulfovibrio alkaliphilus TaxID=2661613 RepID=A0A7K1KJT1_9BACT|nr:YIP1 family protein [Pseudodesulfovibrio alkaliphilus]MUM76132.1 hypothetical protein [Pseudodesulfovibrio alkaliphilus]